MGLSMIKTDRDLPTNLHVCDPIIDTRTRIVVYIGPLQRGSHLHPTAARDPSLPMPLLLLLLPLQRGHHGLGAPQVKTASY
jgi:hypothetical protein